MDIYINDIKQVVAPQSTITAMLQTLAISNIQGIAIAVNQKVIPKKQWNEYVLCQNDKVLIIKATSGG